MPIVSAVGCSAQSLVDDRFASYMEAQMAKTVQECLDRGVSIEDSVTIKAAIMDTIARVKREAGLSETD